jgi:hypothetical protein
MSNANINIVGYLSKFGALGIGLLILSGIFSTIGNAGLASTCQTWGDIILAIVVVGALISIVKRLKI